VGQTFPKHDRITRREDFLIAQKRGRRVNSSHFVLVIYHRNNGGGARLGLVTSRKVANAVGRNRVRRVLRETFRLNKDRFPDHHDVVVIAREGAAALDSSHIRDEILGALARRRGGPQNPRTETS
jgi:ribonuclease P protein component